MTSLVTDDDSCYNKEIKVGPVIVHESGQQPQNFLRKGPVNDYADVFLVVYIRKADV